MSMLAKQLGGQCQGKVFAKGGKAAPAFTKKAKKAACGGKVKK